MDFLLLWFWYIVAFAVGVAVMWAIVAAVVKPTNEDEAIDEALAKEGRDTR